MSNLNETSKSAALYERAKKVMPGGCSRNTILRSPHPIYADFAKGCYVTDIEGVKRIDFANNVASLIHGHAHPKIIEKVNQQMAKGSAFSIGTEVEINYAEHICSRNTGFEQMRFVNSGTEAVMSALKAARAFSGREKIVKVEGAYHGLYDYAEVSQSSNPSNWGQKNRPISNPVSFSTPQGALDDVIIIPFNDEETAITIMNEYASEIACVLIDLLPHRIGVIPATDSFVKAIRKWTSDNNALMICDEVISFRTNYGGAQENYGINADLTTMGKMLGGGFPVGALAGRADVMEVMNPLSDRYLFPHYGTFSANPITMSAGLMAMEMFDRQAVEDINKLGDYARKVISEAIKSADIAACVTGIGSMFRIHLKEKAPTHIVMLI
ncbi:MAG: aminotransferase class III-fold pyridoxal phosphate-dependent enzyme [Devosiaceae bacterium]|nr:aminotransferase class III-fold pyridoxal phosphate-dependent enzyme [Devosiaceae bacterium]